MANVASEIPSVPSSRVEGISDIVFGLALTIGAVPLIGNPPDTQAGLITAIGGFGFSFLVLISVWHRYTIIFREVKTHTASMVRLNYVLLFLVAIEPYLFNLLYSSNAYSAGLAQQASAYFALDVGGMSVILASFSHLYVSEERKQISPEKLAHFTRRRNAAFVVAGMFLISALPFLWQPLFLDMPVRILIWILTLPVAALTRTQF